MYINKYKFCPSQNVDKFKNNVRSTEHVNTCYLLLRGFLTFFWVGEGRTTKGTNYLKHQIIVFTDYGIVL